MGEWPELSGIEGVGRSKCMVLVQSGNITAVTVVLLRCPPVTKHNTPDTVELHIYHSNIVACVVI